MPRSAARRSATCPTDGWCSCRAALPGERALVQAASGAARLCPRRAGVRSQRPAPGRVEPPCPYYRAGCGGCSWQHADYALQLAAEAAHRRRPAAPHRPLFGTEADDAGPPADRHARAVALPQPGALHGRPTLRRAVLHVSRRRTACCASITAGSSTRRSTPTLEVLQGRLSSLGRRIHQVSIRVGANTGQVLVSPALPEVPEVESGQPFFEEELLGRRFRLQPPSFFQVNTRRELRPLPPAIGRAWLPVPDDGLSMAELLALLVHRPPRSPSRADVIVDAYSGVGTFALLLAPLVREVIGIEEARSAVRDAQHNARDVPQRALHPGQDRSRPARARRAGARWRRARPGPRRLPPRRAAAPCSACARAAWCTSRATRPPWPATCASWSTAATRSHEVQPLDMFPQTYHIECVATLTA